MLINGIEYEETPVKNQSCHGCAFYRNVKLGDCMLPPEIQGLDCFGINRPDGQDVQFKKVVKSEIN